MYLLLSIRTCRCPLLQFDESTKTPPDAELKRRMGVAPVLTCFCDTGRFHLFRKGLPEKSRPGTISRAMVQGRGNMIVDERIMVLVVTASELFKKKSSAIFKRYGLTFSQYSVLKYLVGCEHGTDTVGNVSRRMLVTGANVTGLAKRMERCGLIERKNDSKDERLTMLHITPFGMKTLDAIRKIQERHVSEYLDAQSGEQKEAILSVLQGMVRKGKALATSDY